MWAKNKNKNGFTIVELLIVIVVIGILAAITIVAYNGIQARANDSRTLSIANQLEKAIVLWNTDSNEPLKGGWSSTVAFAAGSDNCSDGSGGWIYKGVYACALEDILLAKNLIPAGLITGAPKNKGYSNPPDGRWTFMLYPCSGQGQFALYWYLEAPSASDATNLTAVEGAGCPTAPRTNYAMKAAKLIKLN